MQLIRSRPSASPSFIKAWIDSTPLPSYFITGSVGFNMDSFLLSEPDIYFMKTLHVTDVKLNCKKWLIISRQMVSGNILSIIISTLITTKTMKLFKCRRGFCIRAYRLYNNAGGNLNLSAVTVDVGTSPAAKRRLREERSQIKDSVSHEYRWRFRQICGRMRSCRDAVTNLVKEGGVDEIEPETYK